MNRKDIALSVGGILASMTLAYLLYRHQASPAIAATTQAPPASSPDDSGLADALAYYQVQGMYSAGSSAAAPVPVVSASADTSTSPAISTGIDPATADLLAQVVSAFSSPSPATNGNSLIIPLLNSSPSSTLSNVPVTAGDAINNAVASLPGPVLMPVSQDYSTLQSQASGPSVTSHPVNAHPITLAGAA